MDPLFGKLKPKWIVVIVLAVSLGFYFLRFAGSSRFYGDSASAFSAGLATLIQVGTGVFSWFVWLPRTWARRRYGAFAIWAMLLVAAIVPWHGYVLINYTALPDYIQDSRVVAYLWFVSGITVTIWLLLYWALWVGLTARRQSRRTSQLELQQAQTELLLLKTQIQPHFLLNALNNLYAVSQYAPDRVPELLLKLSEILQYVLYDCLHDRVPIGKERAYLTSYLELYSLRAENPPNVRVDWQIEQPEASLPPMLLQPLIENALKHSQVVYQRQAWVTIELKVNAQRLEATLRNSIAEPLNGKAVPNAHGIGLENVKKRLQLLAPDRHALVSERRGEDYYTHLYLHLS